MALIAVGSLNPIKVSAVQRIVAELWPMARTGGVDVDSGVGAMPLSDELGIQGAQRRAELARKALDADLGIGMEGAVHDASQTMYLTNWVAATHRDGRVSLANGGRLPLPDVIAFELRRGAELGPIIDRCTQEENSKQHMGAAGYLTRNLVPREEAFRLAVAFCLAPFIRPHLFKS